MVSQKTDNPLHWSTIDHKHRKLIMIGLMLGTLAACLDGTIVSTCGSLIAEDLGGLGLYSWMFTVYMLCETIAIPTTGKLSDRYGRRPFFLIGMTLFIAGSGLAGLSTKMDMLIICRAIQGLGGGILVPVATAVFSLLINLRLGEELQSSLDSAVYNAIPHNTNALTYIHLMPENAPVILNSFANSMDFSFFIGGLIILLMVVVAPFMKGFVVSEDQMALETEKSVDEQ